MSTATRWPCRACRPTRMSSLSAARGLGLLIGEPLVFGLQHRAGLNLFLQVGVLLLQLVQGLLGFPAGLWSWSWRILSCSEFSIPQKPLWGLLRSPPAAARSITSASVGGSFWLRIQPERRLRFAGSREVSGRSDPIRLQTWPDTARRPAPHRPSRTPARRSFRSAGGSHQTAAHRDDPVRGLAST